MPRLGGRSTALLLALIFGFALSSFSSTSLARAQEPYSVTVTAHCDMESDDVAVPILIDGTESGFFTPHEFTGLMGTHNFSLANEHTGGHFIKGPPILLSDLADTAPGVVEEGVNWIMIQAPNLLNGQSKTTIEFTYGSRPFIETFRGTFHPGAVASIGVKVYMDPARVARGHLDIYDRDWPINAAATSPSFTSDFAIVGVQPAYAQFEVPDNASVGTWGYVMHIAGSGLDASVNASFEVAYRSIPAPLTFASTEALPYSAFDVGGTRFALFENPNSSSVVLYVGGGTIGRIAGPTPVDGYSDINDWNSGTNRLVHDLVQNGFSVVTPLGAWEGLSFPSAVVAYLRNLGKDTFYAIGHSAGGVVIASNIVDHPDLFSKAVIADAPLTLGSTGFYFTDLSIRSEGVRIPHLLVWGRGDEQAGLENAFAWLDHANKTLATLEIYDYDHDWSGTAAETQVRKQIISFLTDRSHSPPKRGPGDQAAEVVFPNSSPSELLDTRTDFQAVARFRSLISGTLFGSAITSSVGPFWAIMNPWLQQLVANSPAGIPLRLVLYPMGLIFEAGSIIYGTFPTELGAVAAVIVVSSLLALGYVGLPLAVILARSPTLRRIASRLVKPTGAILVVVVLASAVIRVFGPQALLVYLANATMILSVAAVALLSSSLLVALTKLRR